MHRRKFLGIGLLTMAIILVGLTLFVSLTNKTSVTNYPKTYTNEDVFKKIEGETVEVCRAISEEENFFDVDYGFYVQDECLFNLAGKKADATICNFITAKRMERRTACINSVAWDTFDHKPCYLITEKWEGFADNIHIDKCIYELSFRERNKDFCSEIHDQELKAGCLKNSQ